MKIDTDKVDEMLLAIMYLTTFEYGGAIRSWKGYDWESLHRLHEKGMISDPRGKAKSVAFSEEGAKRSKEQFQRFFGLPE
jgi:hypothetical protein